MYNKYYPTQTLENLTIPRSPNRNGSDIHLYAISMSQVKFMSKTQINMNKDIWKVVKSNYYMGLKIHFSNHTKYACKREDDNSQRERKKNSRKHYICDMNHKNLMISHKYW